MILMHIKVIESLGDFIQDKKPLGKNCALQGRVRGVTERSGRIKCGVSGVWEDGM